MNPLAILVCIALAGLIGFIGGWLWRGRKEDRQYEIYPSYSRGMFDPEERK